MRQVISFVERASIAILATGFAARVWAVDGHIWVGNNGSVDRAGSVDSVDGGDNIEVNDP